MSVSENHIPVYVINLKRRADRRAHILNEFFGREEFSVKVVEAFENERGSIGLWNTIIHIIRSVVDGSDDFIIICEDDHQFTEHYTKEHLLNCIKDAMDKSSDILLGGVSSAKSILSVSKLLFWTEDFSGLQFAIIFRRFFARILNAEFMPGDNADHRIAGLTDDKFFIYPFLSIQKEFGYSDITAGNNEPGFVTDLFERTSESVRQIIEVAAFYKSIGSDESCQERPEDLDGISIPAFVINLPARRDRLEHIRKQFMGRDEFDLSVIEACTHEIGAIGLWKSIREVVRIAMDNDEDVIVICEDDHEFTEHYSRRFLMTNIVQAHSQGADILIGGAGGGFNQALPVSGSRFWVDHFYCTQFIVVYRKLFQRILDEPFDDMSITADGLLSILTSHKMLLYPFISIQKEFGYSDVTAVNNLIAGRTTRIFSACDRKLAAIKRVHECRHWYYR